MPSSTAVMSRASGSISAIVIDSKAYDMHEQAFITPRFASSARPPAGRLLQALMWLSAVAANEAAIGHGAVTVRNFPVVSGTTIVGVPATPQ
jgi:hypothetical protein